VLAKTGDYDEAAKVAFDEPSAPLKGEAKDSAFVKVFKNSVGDNLEGQLRRIFAAAHPDEVNALVDALSVQDAANKAEVKRMVYQEMFQTYLKEAIGCDQEELNRLFHLGTTTVN
jgi:hypothetical protein